MPKANKKLNPVIAVYGLWHLGCVTAACLADKGFKVTALDNDLNNIKSLKKSIPPLFEPGLRELIAKNKGKNLTFTSDKKSVSSADITWVCYDTPVDDEDNADTKFVADKVKTLFPYLKNNSVVLVSSQLPVGSVRKLANEYKKSYTKTKVIFAYSPENLRLGKALEVFNNPERIIVGCMDNSAQQILDPVLKKFSNNIIYMGVESAEMVKHAINSFLAVSVTFINEIASICEEVGADAAEVEKGLRSEPRIGQRAYIKPGGAFAGGTLARDIKFLNKIAAVKSLDVPLLGGVIPSNKKHQAWAVKKLLKTFPNLNGKKIAVLGLTYKPETSTLRRSGALEMCGMLSKMNADIHVFEPNIKSLPQDVSRNFKKPLKLSDDLSNIFKNAEAVIIATEHKILKKQNYSGLVKQMKHRLIIDQNKFIFDQLPKNSDIKYFFVGSRN